MITSLMMKTRIDNKIFKFSVKFKNMNNLIYVSQNQVKTVNYTIVGLSMQLCIYCDPKNDEIAITEGGNFYIMQNINVRLATFGDIFENLVSSGLEVALDEKRFRMGYASKNNEYTFTQDNNMTLKRFLKLPIHTYTNLIFDF
jgi:hypothetical protein